MIIARYLQAFVYDLQFIMNVNNERIGDIPEIWPEDKEFTPKGWEDRRRQIINIMCEEQYGFLPAAPVSIKAVTLQTDYEFCAGKAPLSKVMLDITLEDGKIFKMPVSVVIPAESIQAENIPFIVYISFNADVPGKYLPSEEIADNGFGTLSFNYQDITTDDGDFENGLALPLGYTDNSVCGKIALWAWAAMRVMDYACTLPRLDKTRAAVAGHSRLGKTALLAGALDTRFSFVFSNNSGCCGAAISRGKKGETIRNITDSFPCWFKNSFKKYADNENKMPFDQHFLLAVCAPRRVYVSSSSEDLWADPESEFLSCMLAGTIWEKMDLPGFVSGEALLQSGRKPVTGKLYHDGRIAYHEKKGLHYLGREDWQHFMAYLKRSACEVMYFL